LIPRIRLHFSSGSELDETVKDGVDIDREEMHRSGYVDNEDEGGVDIVEKQSFVGGLNQTRDIGNVEKEATDSALGSEDEIDDGENGIGYVDGENWMDDLCDELPTSGNSSSDGYNRSSSEPASELI